MAPLRTRSQPQSEFDVFAATAAGRLVRAGYLMTWDLHETEDLVQETLVRVARHWGRVRAMDHPETYARQVHTNLVLDGRVRRSRRRQELAGDDLAHGIDGRAQRSITQIDLSDEFARALGHLSRTQRTVLVLRYWDGCSEKEVAEVTGMPLGTVKSHAARATARLRVLLDPPSPSGPVGPTAATATAGLEEGTRP